MPKSKLSFTKYDLKRVADVRSWGRGVGYFEDGRVKSLMVDGGVIHARVIGNQDYRVRLWLENGRIEGECSCPMGDEGVFCKHCVAAGLASLAGQAEDLGCDGARDALKRPVRKRKEVAPNDVRAYLANLEKAKLVEIIMGRLPWDDELRRTLSLSAARVCKHGVNLSAYREAINEATQTGRFVDYHSARGFAHDLDAVIDSIQELLDEGYAAEVIELAEHGIARCEQALGSMDDSDGQMSGLMNRLGEIHLSACRTAKPDPEELASRLFRREMETEWDSFYGAVEAYADVLGEKGLAVYRRLAESRWEKLPALKPGDDRDKYSDRRFRVTSIMEALARASGDIEQLVAVKSKDLSLPYSFLMIAEVYREAGRRSEALDWALRGLEIFAQSPDERLEDFVADEYHRLRRHDEAVELIWRRFERHSNLETYLCLKEHADRAKKWPAWREEALKLVREEIAEKASRPKSQDAWTYRRRAGSSLLVEIFLWEKDAESAWREARAGGCSNELWMRMAKLREEDHPADALAVYVDQIAPIVGRTGNEAYREAIGLIGKIRELMGRLDQKERFAGYLAEIRKTYKPKRNFIAMLNLLDSPAGRRR